MSYQEYKNIILDTVRASIQHGLQHQKPLIPDILSAPSALQAQGACFVTLAINHQLRGCIGSLEAYRPLIIDIANNAYAAAFSDPRFAPLSNNELSQISIEVSILGPKQAMEFTDEDDCLNQLRPGFDGVILEDNGRRATFLPSVWESLPEKKDFISHLKLKAGLPAEHWSGSIRIYRYGTEMISERG